MSTFEFLSSNLYVSHLEVVSHVLGGVSVHHGRHVLGVSGPGLPEHLLASDTGAPGAGHHVLCAVTRGAGLAHVLVPGGAGGLRHAAPALRGRGLEAGAVGGSSW